MSLILPNDALDSANIVSILVAIYTTLSALLNTSQYYGFVLADS